ncbi:ABC transporter ATP-binding protein [Ruegeria pomeroyi]|nr:ABC transporter ATP-binding protein [Ruegeria pomeroyi]
MLETRNLNAFYGKSHVLHGVGLRVNSHEVVALVGRNGVGRSTLIKAIMREVQTTGQIIFDGEDLAQMPTHQVARSGIAYVPEHREIFAGLTVAENLALVRAKPRTGALWDIARVLRRFPNLAERMNTDAGVLSGGEQQMLATARALLSDPKLILIDEPTEGLAPRIVQDIARILHELKQDGLAILLVEQKLDIALDVADRIYVMGHGDIVFEGTPAEFEGHPDIRRDWLEV